MKEIKVKDFTYQIINEQDLKGATVAFIYYDLNKMKNKWDFQTFMEAGKQILKFCESLSIKAIFVPTLFSLESLDDYKTAIERLSRDLYEISEKQDEFFHRGNE